MNGPNCGLISFQRFIRSRRVLWCGLAVTVLLPVAMFFWSHRQPAYQGRTLSQWIALHQRHADDAGEITNAVRRMKPRAIPVLLKWISYEQPGWQKFLWRRMPFLTRYSLGRRLCEDWRGAIAKLGLEGFRILGPEGAGAVPTLVKRCDSKAWAKSPTVASRAWTAIQTTGEAGTLVLANIARDPLSSDRITALDLLAHAGAWTTLDEGMPLFVCCLKDENVEVAVRTAQVFRTWGHQLPNAIGALVEALGDARPRVRQAAVEALGQALPSHRRDFPSAIPALRARYNDPDPEVRSAATNALHQVLPPAGGGQIGTEALSAVPKTL